ncbi:MAG: hypothetical protein AAGD05_15490, partial [Bacteroidota bacterium]
EHESVIIPDLGGIVSTYRPASIDNVQGLLHPPSKTLYFNSNLIINDGLLIGFLAKNNQLSDQEAKDRVAAYVEQTQATLERREIVVFPGVGRLYKDYENHLQFLQDSTNFNRNSFGLKSVQFYPILRNKETAITEAPTPQMHEPKSRARKEPALVAFLQSAMPLLAGLALVAFGLTFYMFEQEPSYVDVDPPQKRTVAETRVNQKPTRQQASIINTIDERNELEVPKEEPKMAEPTTALSETPSEVDQESFDTEIDTESLTIGPNQKEGVIIIGTYNFKSSVQKMVNEIYELGYDVYQKKKPGSKSTRVGIQFVYEDRQELNQVLSKVRQTIDERAWVLKR